MIAVAARLASPTSHFHHAMLPCRLCARKMANILADDTWNFLWTETLYIKVEDGQLHVVIYSVMILLC